MTDIRVIKTKNSIKDAFIKALQKKDVSEIRITKLCEKAMINKSTFYKHFTDINDLLNVVQNEYIDELYNSFEYKDKLFSNPTLFMQGLRHLLTTNEKKLKSIFKHGVVFIHKFESKIINLYAKENDSLEHKIKVEFLLSGISRIIAKTKDEKDDPIEIFNFLTKLINKLEVEN